MGFVQVRFEVVAININNIAAFSAAVGILLHAAAWVSTSDERNDPAETAAPKHANEIFFILLPCSASPPPYKNSANRVKRPAGHILWYRIRLQKN